MSNLIFNVRFWYWHFQIRRDRPWVSISFNPFYWKRGIGWGWFQLYRR